MNRLYHDLLFNVEELIEINIGCIHTEVIYECK